jgi:hypothetical protein
MQTNTQIQKSLTQVYNREKKPMGNTYHNGSLQRINSRSSIRSLNSSSSRIKEDNLRMVKKIEATTSHYSRFRDTSYTKKQKPQNYKD